MQKSKNYEREIVNYIPSRLSIDDEGRIWRGNKRADTMRGNGYYCVQLHFNGRRLRAPSHRVVWQWLKGDIPEGKGINHLNGIKTDNRIENLECVTHSENMRHAYENGLLENTVSGKGLITTAKLTEDQVLEIRERVKRGEKQIDVSKDYCVTQANISLIVRGDTWRNAQKKSESR